jgi:hypothetical protein
MRAGEMSYSTWKDPNFPAIKGKNIILYNDESGTLKVKYKSQERQVNTFTELILQLQKCY